MSPPNVALRREIEIDIPAELEDVLRGIGFRIGSTARDRAATVLGQPIEAGNVAGPPDTRVLRRPMTPVRHARPACSTAIPCLPLRAHQDDLARNAPLPE